MSSKHWSNNFGINKVEDITDAQCSSWFQVSKRVSFTYFLEIQVLCIKDMTAMCSIHRYWDVPVGLSGTLSIGLPFLYKKE